jgi:hypothetical protein
MSVRAVLVCYRYHPNSAEWTYWDSREQAREANAELAAPWCGPACIGFHSAVSVYVEPDPRRRAGQKSLAAREVGR